MFDKEKFSIILEKINKTYPTMTEFGKRASFDRTYISKYINMKLANPPTPKILEKIANASNGITTYEELMNICGYLENIKNSFSDILLDFWGVVSLDSNIITEEFEKNIQNMKLTYNEICELCCILSNCNDFTNIQYENTSSKIKYLLDNYNLQLVYLYNKLNSLSHLQKNIVNSFCELFKVNKPKKPSKNKLFNIPILGKIAAGQPLLAEEYLEGYLPVEPSIYGMTTPDDYFYLRVSGESMNLKIHNGDYALIHKQNYAENGDIIVAIVNGDDEATLKRYKIISNEMVMLEPMSTYPMEPIIINLKETKFQIIGKAIGQFGKF